MDVTLPQKHLSSAVTIFLSLWFSLSALAAVTENVIVLRLFNENESLWTIHHRSFMNCKQLLDTAISFLQSLKDYIIAVGLHNRGDCFEFV